LHISVATRIPETFSAIDRLPAIRTKWNLAIFAALAAHCVKELHVRTTIIVRKVGI
jgi:hypothetical protein